MRNATRILASLLAVATLPAAASEIDCFPACTTIETAPRAPAIDLCRSAVVQEGMKLEARVRPAKQLYEIASDPTGYAIKTVTDAAGIKVPKVVGYALNPKGSLKAEVMKRVRAEAKKQAGLEHDCAPTASDDE
jgi:hypothetical protein